jgi:hypothetical protein
MRACPQCCIDSLALHRDRKESRGEPDLGNTESTSPWLRVVVRLSPISRARGTNQPNCPSLPGAMTAAHYVPRVQNASGGAFRRMARRLYVLPTRT